MLDPKIILDYALQYGRVLVDIGIVSVLVYQVYRRISHTRAIPVLSGVGMLLLLSYAARIMRLDTLSVLFDWISAYLIIAVIVVLQPELRRLFYQLGQTNWYKTFVATQQVNVEEILNATVTMAEEKIGALMVLVNKNNLSQLVEGGIPIEGELTRELLISIFYEGNPLHDGAVLIEGEKIISAANYLPLSNSNQLKRTAGARHRSGLGISEESDALVIIVSEEKGKISVCYSGTMQENINPVQLKSLLSAFNTNRLDEEWDLLFTKGSRKDLPETPKKKNTKKVPK